MKRYDFSFGIIPLRRKGQWEVLLIKHHHGHWAFPKGHQEPGETGQEAAVRELKEETNVQVKRFFNALPLEEHYFFHQKGALIEKTVTYYLAEVEGAVAIQKEEIADFCWASLEEAEKIITFSEGKQLCKAILDSIPTDEANF